MALQHPANRIEGSHYIAALDKKARISGGLVISPSPASTPEFPDPLLREVMIKGRSADREAADHVADEGIALPVPQHRLGLAAQLRRQFARTPSPPSAGPGGPSVRPRRGPRRPAPIRLRRTHRAAARGSGRGPRRMRILPACYPFP